MNVSFIRHGPLFDSLFWIKSTFQCDACGHHVDTSETSNGVCCLLSWVWGKTNCLCLRLNKSTDNDYEGSKSSVGLPPCLHRQRPTADVELRSAMTIKIVLLLILSYYCISLNPILSISLQVIVCIRSVCQQI